MYFLIDSSPFLSYNKCISWWWVTTDTLAGKQNSDKAGWCWEERICKEVNAKMLDKRCHIQYIEYAKMSLYLANIHCNISNIWAECPDRCGYWTAHKKHHQTQSSPWHISTHNHTYVTMLDRTLETKTDVDAGPKRARVFYCPTNFSLVWQPLLEDR